MDRDTSRKKPCVAMRVKAGRTISLEGAATREYDAVVVPGGGLDPGTDKPRPWVCARLSAALSLEPVTQYFLVLSRGTTHRPPPADALGFPIDEAAASAAFMLKAGVAEERLLLDTWSLDTIGNAYFARQMIASPMHLHRLCVITSAFHMSRTRAIFEWVFGLDAEENYEIDYCCVPNTGLSDEEAAARTAKEESSLATLRTDTIPRIDTLNKLARFVLVEHGAYNAKIRATADSPAESDGLLDVAAQSTY